MEKQLKKKSRVSMPKSEKSSIKLLSQGVGEFIQYWGFRRIHGEIWAQIFLANEPLSGAELVKRLGVSKALISPALKQLEKYNLILHADSPDSREKRYTANPDYLAVIKSVLLQREAPMLAKIQTDFYDFKDKFEADAQLKQKVNFDRIRELQILILQANMFVGALLALEDFKSLQKLADVIQESV